MQLAHREVLCQVPLLIRTLPELHWEQPSTAYKESSLALDGDTSSMGILRRGRLTEEVGEKRE